MQTIDLYTAGLEAHARNEMRAPGGNAVFMEAIKDLPVGSKEFKRYAKEFTLGFDAGIEAELKTLGF